LAGSQLRRRWRALYPNGLEYWTPEWSVHPQEMGLKFTERQIIVQQAADLDGRIHFALFEPFRLARIAQAERSGQESFLAAKRGQHQML